MHLAKRNYTTFRLTIAINGPSNVHPMAIASSPVLVRPVFTVQAFKTVNAQTINNQTYYYRPPALSSAACAKFQQTYLYDQGRRNITSGIVRTQTMSPGRTTSKVLAMALHPHCQLPYPVHETCFHVNSNYVESDSFKKIQAASHAFKCKLGQCYISVWFHNRQNQWVCYNEHLTSHYWCIYQSIIPAYSIYNLWINKYMYRLQGGGGGSLPLICSHKQGFTPWCKMH